MMRSGRGEGDIDDEEWKGGGDENTHLSYQF